MERIADELVRLQALHQDAFLTDDEYETQRGALLSRNASGELNLEDCCGEELTKLAGLVRSGTLTREEFDEQKSAMLWTTGDEIDEEGDESDVALVDDIDYAPIPTGWEWILVFAGGIAAIGSLLPWEQASTGLFSVTRNGFQLGNDLSFSSDGLIVLALAVIGMLIGITRLAHRPFPRWVNSSPTVVGLVIAYLGISDESNMTSTVNGLHAQYPNGVFSVGYGVWMVIVGGCLICLAGVAGWLIRRRALRKGFASA